jgi:hypothetical protein
MQGKISPHNRATRSSDINYLRPKKYRAGAANNSSPFSFSPFLVSKEKNVFF